MTFRIRGADRSYDFLEAFQCKPACGIKGNVAPFWVSPGKRGQTVVQKSNLGGLVDKFVKLCMVRDGPWGGNHASLPFDEDKMEHIIVRDRSQITQGANKLSSSGRKSETSN